MFLKLVVGIALLELLILTHFFPKISKIKNKVVLWRCQFSANVSNINYPIECEPFCLFFFNNIAEFVFIQLKERSRYSETIFLFHSKNVSVKPINIFHQGFSRYLDPLSNFVWKTILKILLRCFKKLQKPKSGKMHSDSAFRTVRRWG